MICALSITSKLSKHLRCVSFSNWDHLPKIFNMSDKQMHYTYQNNKKWPVSFFLSFDYASKKMLLNLSRMKLTGGTPWLQSVLWLLRTANVLQIMSSRTLATFWNRIKNLQINFWDLFNRWFYWKKMSIRTKKNSPLGCYLVSWIWFKKKLIGVFRNALN